MSRIELTAPSDAGLPSPPPGQPGAKPRQIRRPRPGVRPLLTWGSAVVGGIGGLISMGALAGSIGGLWESCPQWSAPRWCIEDVAGFTGAVLGAGYGGALGFRIGERVTERRYAPLAKRPELRNKEISPSQRPLMLGIAAVVGGAIPLLGLFPGTWFGAAAIHSAIRGAPYAPGKRPSWAIRAAGLALGTAALLITGVVSYSSSYGL